MLNFFSAIPYALNKNLKKIGAVSERDFEKIENTLKILNVSTKNKKKQLIHLRQRFAEIKQQLELQKSSTVECIPGDSEVVACGGICSLRVLNKVFINLNCHGYDIFVDWFGFLG